jgi:hypothetical protein
MSTADVFAYRPVRWPAIVVGVAILAGLAMLAAATLLHWRSAAVMSELTAPASSAQGVARPAEHSRHGPLFTLVPSAAMRLSDIRTVYELAGEKRVALPSVEYRSEAQPKAGLVLEHMDLRLEEDYPKVKLLLAELLRALPNLMVEEIDIQAAGSGPAARIQTTARLTLVYLAAESAPKFDKAASSP